MKTLQKQTDALRYTALETLVLHYASLRDEDLLEASSDATADVERALQSLADETRGVGTKDKLIRTKGEFERLKRVRAAMVGGDERNAVDA